MRVMGVGEPLPRFRFMHQRHGSKADIAELQDIAESEGADGMQIEKKALKSGREIWTLHGGG